jgi:aspartyl-tRNA synthetase
MPEPSTNSAPPAAETPAETPAEAPAAEGGESGTISKKAAKKAEAKAKKEAEKARRALEQAAAAAASGAAAQTEDLAKDNYGQETHETKLSPDAIEINLKTLGDEHVGKTVELRAWIQNARMQGAKMAFVELREEGNWAIQGVVTASKEGTPVSRQMVKWVGAINPESFVVVEATVAKPVVPVKATRITNYELHITKCFVHAAAPSMLGMTLAAANRPVANFSDEEVPVEQGVENLSIATAGEATGTPAATMLTHLDNIVMHKRSAVQQAIADIRAEMKELYRSYLRSHGFKEFEPPCLIGAASEGGANVFRMPYFEKEAFLGRWSPTWRRLGIYADPSKPNHPSSTSKSKSRAGGSACSASAQCSGPRTRILRGT